MARMLPGNLIRSRRRKVHQDAMSGSRQFPSPQELSTLGGFAFGDGLCVAMGLPEAEVQESFHPTLAPHMTPQVSRHILPIWGPSSQVRSGTEWWNGASGRST